MTAAAVAIWTSNAPMSEPLPPIALVFGRSTGRTALVGRESRIAFVNGDAAREQRVSLRRPAVIRQRTEIRIARQIVRVRAVDAGQIVFDQTVTRINRAAVVKTIAARRTVGDNRVVQGRNAAAAARDSAARI